MKNQQNTVIVVLIVTAAILAGMLVGVWQDKAQAAYPSVSKGDYIMFACSWSDDYDLLCVIDVAAHKMKTYSINKTTKGLDVSPDVDLERVFAAAE
jgi:hypothetical protein